MTANETKKARIESRLSVEQKEIIERAAAYQGRSVSDFVVANAEQAARTIIEEHERLKLNRAQSRMLVEALLSQNPPNKRLKAAATRHRQQVKSR